MDGGAGKCLAPISFAPKRMARYFVVELGFSQPRVASPTKGVAKMPAENCPTFLEGLAVFSGISEVNEMPNN